MGVSTREISRTISDMAKGLNAIPMEIRTTVTLKWVKLMVKEYIHGAMEKCMMANGIKDSSMVMEFGEDFTMIPILASGGHQRQKAMECILGRMVIDMKASGSNVSSTVKEQIFLQTVISTLESIKMESLKAKVSILGVMALSTLESSRMD